MVALANVALANTFQQWMTRTNELLVRVNKHMTSNTNLFGDTVTANSTFTLSTGGTMSVPAGAFTSNTWHANSTITAHALGANSVVAGKIAVGAVSSNAALASSVVTSHAVAALAITTGKVGNLQITSGKLAANSVIAGKINTGAIASNAAHASATLTKHALFTPQVIQVANSTGGILKTVWGVGA